MALVGKGITFDTGGISIKPAANMHHMTSDMGGAAAVIATVVLAAKQELPIDVIATVPMAENMPSSTAQRPGDVLTQYGGITVEVLNTDAEGRLILADAIVRACEDEPDYLIETSTLTGAQTVALGARTPGVMGSDEFRDRVAEISQAVGENGWPMPLPEELKDDLKSTVADLANVSGSRYAGMLVAGTYLREFVADGVQWAHIDIAGPAYNTGGPWGYTGKGGTGVPTRTMFAVLEDISTERLSDRTRPRAVLRIACGSSSRHAVDEVGLRRHRPDRLVLLDRRHDRLGHLVRPVASCGEQPSRTARVGPPPGLPGRRARRNAWCARCWCRRRRGRSWSARFRPHRVRPAGSRRTCTPRPCWCSTRSSTAAARTPPSTRR